MRDRVQKKVLQQQEDIIKMLQKWRKKDKEEKADIKER